MINGSKAYRASRLRSCSGTYKQYRYNNAMSTYCGLCDSRSGIATHIIYRYYTQSGIKCCTKSGINIRQKKEIIQQCVE